MKKFKSFIVLLATVIVSAGLSTCGDIINPPNKLLDGEKAALANPGMANVNFQPVTLTPGENHVEVCCASTGSGNSIIDGNTSTFWGSRYNSWNGNSEWQTEENLHVYYGPHWVTIDLGQVYTNVSRIEYVPIWNWPDPGGYGSWNNNTPNNGVVTGFEIYLSENAIKDGNNPPPETRVGYGEWYALENGSNQKITGGSNANMKFFATFSGARGRYLQFRITRGYRNHWASYLSAIGQIAELRVWRSDKPFQVDMSGLRKMLNDAENLKRTYLPRYGYTNAMLKNWGDKAEAYLGNPNGITQESVDYVRTNMQDYLKMAGTRMGTDTYNRFIQRIVWADDKGNHLQAHGGGTMWDPVSQKWWFYGEDRATNTTGGGQPGVHAYSSEDMYNWKDEGVAFPIFNNTVYDEPDWREAGSVNHDGFPGGWDGNRHNPSGGGGSGRNPAGPVAIGFMWTVNKWRQSMGDWTSSIYDNGKIASALLNPANVYPNAAWRTTNNQNAPFQINEGGTGYFVSNTRGPGLMEGAGAAQNALWSSISPHLPEGNPPMYLYLDPAAKPYATALGLTQAKVDGLNALYRDIPVWRRKQLYRFWNHTTTVERPKVVFNAGGNPQYQYWDNTTPTGGLHPNGKPIRPYEDPTGVYPYVMFTHIEGGVIGNGYGTAKVAISVAKHPAGPFKLLWAYHTHFVENWTRETDHKGMTRDQSVLIDDDGVAYHFGSTQENRTMGINMLNETYTGFEGIPRFPVGESQDQMIEEGYNNLLGVNFNLVFGDQREAPAPFIYYTLQNVTYEGRIDPDTGARSFLSLNDRNTKYYYAASSTSTGWFPNPQGVYRTSRAFGEGDAGRGRILGYPGHAKPTGGNDYYTPNGADPTAANTGTGWVGIAGNGGGNIGTNGAQGANGSFFFGTADDGSIVTKGYDGQTTYVQQLRYPEYKWDIVGFMDEDFAEPDESAWLPDDPDNPDTKLNPLDPRSIEAYYTYLAGQFPGTYRKPIYGPTEIKEPRHNRLVRGKYIHMSDSWDSIKNYDARYIWLPMRVTGTGYGGGDYGNGAYGTRARWMREWRWEDFVYDLGPFANSLDNDPPRIKDSSGGDSQSMWTNAADVQNLLDYYEMLEKSRGSSRDLYLNQGKQNPGQNWLDIWLN